MKPKPLLSFFHSFVNRPSPPSLTSQRDRKSNTGTAVLEQRYRNNDTATTPQQHRSTTAMAIDPKAIIHPQAANSLYDTMSQLQSPHSLISNRLHSIANDALSVGPVAWDYGFVVVANQRSGSWYVNPELQADPVDAYFKSTDGHFGQWAFSLRRLNLGVLDAMNQYDQGGYVRRGVSPPAVVPCTVLIVRGPDASLSIRRAKVKACPTRWPRPFPSG